MTDCVQCREWELCPFHPKEEWEEPTVDLAAVFPEEAWHLTVPKSSEPVLKRADTPGAKAWWARIDTGKRIPVSSDSTHTVTDDGQYVQTWRDGVVVDEEPIEAYQS